MGFLDFKRKWEPKETRLLIRQYRTYPTDEIATVLARSPESIYNKARSLGLKKVNPATLKKLAERRKKAARVRARRGR